MPQLKLQHRHGAKLHDIYWNQTLGIKRHGHFAQAITKWRPNPGGESRSPQVLLSLPCSMVQSSLEAA